MQEDLQGAHGALFARRLSSRLGRPHGAVVTRPKCEGRVPSSSSLNVSKSEFFQACLGLLTTTTHNTLFRRHLRKPTPLHPYTLFGDISASQGKPDTTIHSEKKKNLFVLRPKMIITGNNENTVQYTIQARHTNVRLRRHTQANETETQQPPKPWHNEQKPNCSCSTACGAGQIRSRTAPAPPGALRPPPAPGTPPLTPPSPATGPPLPSTRRPLECCRRSSGPKAPPGG